MILHQQEDSFPFCIFTSIRLCLIDMDSQHSLYKFLQLYINHMDFFFPIKWFLLYRSRFIFIFLCFYRRSVTTCFVVDLLWGSCVVAYQLLRGFFVLAVQMTKFDPTESSVPIIFVRMLLIFLDYQMCRS